MIFKIMLEIFQRALQWFHRSWCQSTKGIARCQKPGLKFEDVEIFHFATAFLQSIQQTRCPGKSFPAGCAPAARFMSEKMFQTANHSHWAGLIIQYDDGSRSEPAAGFHYGGEIHGHIQMIGCEKIGRAATRQYTAQRMSFFHPARMIFQNLSQGSTERKLPQTRIADMAAGSIDFCAALSGQTKIFEPFCTPQDDMRYIDDGFYIIDYGRFSKKTADHRKRRFGTR